MRRDRTVDVIRGAETWRYYLVPSRRAVRGWCVMTSDGQVLHDPCYLTLGPIVASLGRRHPGSRVKCRHHGSCEPPLPTPCRPHPSPPARPGIIEEA